MRICMRRKTPLNTVAAANWDRLLGLIKMIIPVSNNLCVDKTLQGVSVNSRFRIINEGNVKLTLPSTRLWKHNFHKGSQTFATHLHDQGRNRREARLD